MQKPCQAFPAACLLTPYSLLLTPVSWFWLRLRRDVFDNPLPYSSPVEGLAGGCRANWGEVNR